MRGNRLLKFIDFYIGVPMVFLLSVFHTKRKRPGRLESVAISLYGALGDAVLLLPVVNVLLKQNIAVTIFCTASNAEVFELLGKRNYKVIRVPITNIIKSFLIMRRHPTDIFIDASQWQRMSALLSFLHPSQFAIGFLTNRQYRHRLFDLAVEHSAQIHEEDNFKNLLKVVTAAPCGRINYEDLELEDAPAVNKLSVSNEEKMIIFHPWAAGVKYSQREWPIENWLALADRFAELQYQLIVTTSPRDLERTLMLVGKRQLESLSYVLMDIHDVVKLIQKSQLLITVNTGIMHLGSLTSTPVLALNGPTNSSRWGVVGNNNRNLSVASSDGGAFLNLGFEYEPTKPYVMDKLTVDMVFSHARSMLRE